MGKKLIGVVLLGVGIVIAIFGYIYNNSAQHQLLSAVNTVTGGSDPIGTVAIVVGAIIAIIGGALLVVGGSKA